MVEIVTVGRRGFISGGAALATIGARASPRAGQFSTAALDHYRRICIACREAGITPMVTFHHFTSPRWIAGRGGWLVREMRPRLDRRM